MTPGIMAIASTPIAITSKPVPKTSRQMLNGILYRSHRAAISRQSVVVSVLSGTPVSGVSNASYGFGWTLINLRPRHKHQPRCSDRHVNNQIQQRHQPAVAINLTHRQIAAADKNRIG